MDVVDVISEQATETVPTVAGFFQVLIEAVRLREEQLTFTDMQATYTAGDIITVSLKETIIRPSALGLWVVVISEDRSFLYVTKQGFFADT